MKKVFSSAVAVSMLALGLSSLGACSSSSSQTNQADSTMQDSQPTRQASPFDADSAYSYVQHQVDLGPRTPGSEAHQLCQQWIVAKLESWGYQVTQQKFEGKSYFGEPIHGTNIIATRTPETKPRYTLMAHWDTRPVADQDPNPSRQALAIDGADDGGSGVAVLLEMARQESIKPSGKGLDFVFFDLEDGGASQDEESWCQGSQYWAQHPHIAGYSAEGGILLDMVGAKGAKFYWETFSKDHARPLLSALWQMAGELGWGDYFIQADGSAMTDDHVPVIRYLGIPSVDIINYDPNRDTGFGAHWHTSGDGLGVIDRTTLQAVGQTVLTTLREGL